MSSVNNQLLELFDLKEFAGQRKIIISSEGTALRNNLKYSLNTSNESLENYESLAFSINILRDEPPRLKVEMVRDSVELETLYFYGQATDDYGLNKLELIYYQTNH